MTPDSSRSHRARRRFGQNFLRDPFVIDRIVQAIAPQPDQSLVEIGPGQGALTVPLLRAAHRLTAIEIDRDLIEPLERVTRAHGTLTLVQEDILNVRLSEVLTPAPDTALRIVGNLPYNISTPLIFSLLDQVELIEDMHFMLQREVAERMVANAGESAYGRLSVMVGLSCDAEILFTVPPEAFRPVPKVVSAMVRLRPHAVPPFDGDYQQLAHLVGQAFAQRRKTLRNSLKTMLDADSIAAAGVDPQARPETLTLAQFAALARRMASSASPASSQPTKPLG